MAGASGHVDSEQFRPVPWTYLHPGGRLTLRQSRREGPPMSGMGRREFMTLLGAAAAVVAAPLEAAAQDYPNRPVTLIVNFPPGGSTDAVARIIREPLSQALVQSIIIDNRGGAGGATPGAAGAPTEPPAHTPL